jgi:peroxiredoxin
MALRQSRMLALGTPAPEFTLPDATGTMHSLAQYAGSPALLVAFICNHCPYVQHILGGLAAFANEYKSRGLNTVAISSNDVKAYPQDGPAEMARMAKKHAFTFPYLYDESQAAALAYQAICTPDLFLFDRDRRLVYRGQFDGSRPGSKVPVTGADLRAAVDSVLKGAPVAADQMPSAGCSIKWKHGKEPEWA